MTGHDGDRVCDFTCEAVFQVKLLGESRIELYDRTLERPMEGTADDDVKLGAVECTIARLTCHLPALW